jgi:ZIP family zinc transporter/zinc and cadmium transporter
MDIFIYVALAAAANIAGGLVILIKKDWSRRGMMGLMALSSGLLISLTVVDLLPEVIPNHRLSPIFILLGILCIFFFQQFMASHFHFGEETHEHHHSQSTMIGAFGGMVLHTFFDGFSIVASFEVNVQLGVTVLIAVLLHKIPDGLTISSIVLTASKSKKMAAYASILLGLSTVAGALGAVLLHVFDLPQETLTILALSFSAGIFLYVGGTDLLPIVNAQDDRLLSIIFFLGIVLYFVLQFTIQALTPAFG